MSVLVDTSVWSIGLRRRRRDLNPLEMKIYYQWEQLLIRGDAVLVGPILQETLSGIADIAEFEALKQRLLLVQQLSINSDTFILAARFYNACRAHGISSGAVDMTICAAAHAHRTPIFTTDPDFPRYARHLPIALIKP